MNRCAILVAVPLLVSAPAVAAPGLEARIRHLEPETELRVGTPIRLEVTARHAPGGVALLPSDWALPSALGERTSARVHERKTDDGDELDIYRLELIPFEAGLVEIPPLTLALGSTVAETEPLLVEVASTLDPEELESVSSTAPETLGTLERLAAGDPPPEGLLVPDVRLALAALAALVALLIAVISWVMWKRRPPRAAPPPPPPRPAHELAFAELDALEKSDLLEQGAFNPYYTALSAALRAYLGRRYDFDAVERTVDELTETLDGMHTPGLDRRALKVLLTEADQIKFAKFRPRREEAERALAEARQLVQRTQVGAQTQTDVRPEAQP